MDDSKTYIEILTYPHLRPDFKVDGRYFLDLEEEERIPTYEDVNDNDPTNIQVIAAYGISLRYTDKNISALRPFLNATTGELSGSGVNVVVIRGGIYLPFRKMFVKRIDDSNRRIEVELQFGYDFWVDLLERLKINQVNFDPTLFTTPNILDINQNKYIYNDGDNGVVFPWVNYGRPYVKDTLNLYDLRPFVHILALLRKAFQQIDHSFVCPLLESDFGRHLACYLLRSDYGNNTSDNKRRNLTVALNQDVSVINQAQLYNNIPFNSIIDDPGNAWNKFDIPVFTDASYYRIGSGFVGTIQWGFLMEISNIKSFNPWFHSEPSFRTELWIEYPGNDAPLRLHKEELEFFFDNGPSLFKANVNVKLENMEIPPDSKLYVKLFYDYPKRFDMKIKAGAYFQVIPDKSIYSEGDTILMYNELDNKISCMDVFRAVSHFISGKVYWNYSLKQVVLLSAFEAEFFGEQLEGFFKTQGYVLVEAEKIVPDSLIIESEAELERYNLTLGFARSSDPAITEDKAISNDKTQIFDSTNMVGLQGVLKPDRESRNPLFEPTINKPFNLFVSLNNSDPALDRYPLDMPYLTDNIAQDGELPDVSFNINPRILYLNGYDAYRVRTPDGNLGVPGAVFQNNDVAPFYAFQYPNMLTEDGNIIDRYFIYGVAENDLYQKFYRFYLQESRNNLPYKLLLYLSVSDEDKINFRDRVLIDYMGSEMLGRITIKEDYDGGISGMPTPVVFYPFSSLKKVSADDDTPLEIRTNCDVDNLFIDIQYADGCYTASLGGSSSSAITDVIFKYKMRSDNTYTDGDQVCNPSEPFTFSMQVIFTEEECNDFYITQTVSPCQNEVEIKFDYDPISGCLQISYDENYVTSEVANVKIFYQKDEEPEQEYTGPICDLEGVEKIKARIILEFDGGCLSIEGEGEYDFPPDEYDCNLNQPELSYEEVGNCQIIPVLGGTIIEEILQEDCIQYRYDENDDWQDWDGGTPLSKPVYLLRISVFLTGCDPILTEIYVE